MRRSSRQARGGQAATAESLPSHGGVPIRCPNPSGTPRGGRNTIGWKTSIFSFLCPTEQRMRGGVHTLPPATLTLSAIDPRGDPVHLDSARGRRRTSIARRRRTKCGSEDARRAPERGFARASGPAGGGYGCQLPPRRGCARALLRPRFAVVAPCPRHGGGELLL
jgi:hypothetical protein